MVIGSITRIVYCWKYPVPVRDSYIYSELILEWNETGKLDDERIVPPLGLFIIGLPNKLWGIDVIKGGVCINIILSLLTNSIFVLIGSKFIKSSIVLTLTGIAIATHPQLVHYSCQALRESSYIFFTTCSLYIVLEKGVKSNTIRIILCGTFTALAILCRYEACENIIIYLFILLTNGHIAIKTKIKKASYFITGCVLGGIAVLMELNITMNYFDQFDKMIENKSTINLSWGIQE